MFTRQWSILPTISVINEQVSSNIKSPKLANDFIVMERIFRTALMQFIIFSLFVRLSLCVSDPDRYSAGVTERFQALTYEGGLSVFPAIEAKRYLKSDVLVRRSPQSGSCEAGFGKCPGIDPLVSFWLIQEQISVASLEIYAVPMVVHPLALFVAELVSS
jgi:hypothetical protein